MPSKQCDRMHCLWQYYAVKWSWVKIIEHQVSWGWDCDRHLPNLWGLSCCRAKHLRQEPLSHPGQMLLVVASRLHWWHVQLVACKLCMSSSIGLNRDSPQYKPAALSVFQSPACHQVFNRCLPSIAELQKAPIKIFRTRIAFPSDVDSGLRSWLIVLTTFRGILLSTFHCRMIDHYLILSPSPDRSSILTSWPSVRQWMQEQKSAVSCMRVRHSIATLRSNWRCCLVAQWVSPPSIMHLIEPHSALMRIVTWRRTHGEESADEWLWPASKRPWHQRINAAGI